MTCTKDTQSSQFSFWPICFSDLSIKLYISQNWTASSEFGTYRLCEQWRFRRACASAQSRQNLRCSLMQAVSQEEPSDRKPDPWPLWMAGHAQLKFVMTECSKTQIRLTGLIYKPSLICLFCCLMSQSTMIMSRWPVNLTTLFLGRLPKGLTGLTSTQCAHPFTSIWQLPYVNCPTWISGRERMKASLTERSSSPAENKDTRVFILSGVRLRFQYEQHHEKTCFSSLISAFVVRCLDSIIPLYVQNFKSLPSSCGCAGWFECTRSQLPKTGFLMTRLI